MSKLSLSLLSLLVAGAACEAPTAPGDRDNLTAARALWNAKNASS